MSRRARWNFVYGGERISVYGFASARKENGHVSDILKSIETTYRNNMNYINQGACELRGNEAQAVVA